MLEYYHQDGVTLALGLNLVSRCFKQWVEVRIDNKRQNYYKLLKINRQCSIDDKYVELKKIWVCMLEFENVELKNKISNHLSTYFVYFNCDVIII